MSRPRAALRLVPVAAAAWSTAGIASIVPALAAPLAVLLWLLSVTVVAWNVRRRAGSRVAVTAVIVVLAAAAAAAVASHVALAQPARARVAELTLEGGRAITMVAQVTGKIERRASGDLAFDAHVTSIAVGSQREAVDIAVSVQVQPEDVEGSPLLDAGSAVEIRGTAAPTDPGDREVLWVRASRGVTVTEPPSGPLAVTADLRRGLVTAVTGLPGPAAGLVPGLAVGDTSAVDPTLDAAMKSSSLSHLTAVSGANCALVVGIAFAGAAVCGARRAVRVVAGVTALLGFVLLVTPEPSVVRAGAMAAIAMFGVLLARPATGMAILSLAVAVVLIADPWLATSLGFALSSAATASLLLFARPLAAGLGRWMPRALALGLSVPLAAQLACGPLLVLIAPSVPLYGVIANLLAAPAAPVATIVGLLACLAAPVPALQAGLATIAWLPAAWISTTAETFATLPGNQIPWWEGGAGLLTLALLGGAVGVLVGMPRGSGRLRRLSRGLAGGVLSLTLGVGAGATLSSTVLGSWTVPREWSVIACEVGQGDAVLIRSATAIALIDTGPEPAPLEKCLSRVGIDRVDLLVLTHFDLDHVGGVSAVTGRVDTVLHGPPANADDEEVLAGLVANGADAVDGRAGVVGTLGAASWRVLWPPAQSAAFTTGNDASVVLDVRGGGVPSTLLLGDLSASPQRALAASDLLAPPYDVVKVAHHGSADQDDRLYDLVDGAVSLITVGEDNDYGHPRAETLALLDHAHARVARTDRQGLIALWLAADAVHVWRERGGDVAPAD